MVDGGFMEDIPCDIERELCGKWDRVIIGRGGKRQLIGRTGRGFI